ncbi:MAG: redox-sensing transcriptional repressor Rex [Pirellulales bacterium]
MSDSQDKSPDSAAAEAVPKAVVSRLSLYLRELQHIQQEGSQTTSSTQLGRMLGLTDAQVRKDLAYFGQFGYPGIGYRCEELIQKIREILGTNREWPVVLVGVGNLGRALLGYRGFGRQGFKVVAAFDSDPEKIHREIDGVPVFPLEQIPELVRAQGIRLAILAVPAQAAQGVADQLVGAGVVGVLNFAPVTLNLPAEVAKIGVDLAMELEQLTFAVANRAGCQIREGS